MKNNDVINYEMHSRLSHSIFVSIIAIFLGLTYWAARFGFDDNSLYLVFEVIALSFFFIFLPNIIDLAKLKLHSPESWYNSSPFVSIVGLFVLFLAGLIAPVIKLLYPIGILGLAFFAVSLYAYIKVSQKKTAIFAACIFAIIFSLWVAGIIWGKGFLNPLFFEKIVTGSVNADSIFHSAIASMIKTNWVPSIGLDGIPYIKYHWGSHYIFAQISKLLNIGTLDFYNFAYPVIFAPFVVRSFLYLIDAFRAVFKIRLSLDWRFYLFLLFAFTGIVPLGMIGKAGMFIGDVFISESYSLSLAVAFILLGLLLQFKEQIFLRKPSLSIKIFAIAVLPLMLGLIGLLKISVFILLAVSFIYFFIRLKLYRNINFVLSAVFALAISLAVFKYSYLGGESKYFLFHYLKTWVDIDYRIFFPLFYFFWVWVYLVIRLKLLGAKTFKDIRWLLKRKKILDLELLLIVAVAGVIPGMVFDIPGGSAFFFSDFQRWLALSFVLATIPLWWPRKFFYEERRMSGLLFFPTCFVLLITLAAFCSYKNIKDTFVYGFVFENIKIRYQLMPEESEVRKMGHIGYVKYLISQKRTPAIKAFVAAASEPQKKLNEDKGYQLIKFLKAQSFLSDKNKLAIFIPQDNYLYWNLVAYENVQFIGPSLTGMPMIGGIQPFIPAKLSEKEMKALTVGFDDKQIKTLTSFYSTVDDRETGQLQEKQTVEYLLRKDLSYDEKIVIYDLIAPKYYRFLKYRGFWSYDFPSEKEYLEKFSSDEKICQQATEKKFSRVIIITDDQDSNTRSRTLNCK